MLQLRHSGGKLSSRVVPGGRLPSSRVGCRAAVLKHLVEGKDFLAVAGGFRAWGGEQRTYRGPLDDQVALLELHSGSGNVQTPGGTSWVGESSGVDRGDLEQLPVKLRQPAVCIAEWETPGQPREL